MSPSPGPLLTLEPFIDAVREGVEATGWALSGLQKTTSLQFEGRWEGESTRSAYLFFHHPRRWEAAGVEAYLDETSRGLQGSLSLVVDAASLGALGDPSEALAAFGAAAGERLPAGLRTPVSLRVRLPEPRADPAGSDVEVRFKVGVTGRVLDRGGAEVAALATTTVRSFESLLVHPGLERLIRPDRAEGEERADAPDP